MADGFIGRYRIDPDAAGNRDIPGRTGGRRAESGRARRLFILPNVWILSFIPFSCCFNILDGLAEGYFGLIAPVPLIGNSIPVFIICCIGYIAVCIVADVVLAKELRQRMSERK